MNSSFLITLLASLAGLSVGLVILALRRQEARRTGAKEFLHLPLRAANACRVRLRHAPSDYLTLPFPVPGGTKPRKARRKNAA